MLEAFDAGTLGAVAAGIGEDLAAEVGTDKFQVDLQALHDYYYKVYNLWEGLNHYARDLPQDPYSAQCIATSGIPGVADAIQATVDGALGQADSMVVAVNSVRANLGQHLQALADVYTAYVQVDQQKATELTQAGTPSAANINMNLPDPLSGFTVPSWVTSLVSG